MELNADIGSGNGYSGKTIDLTKYFRAAGGVHLASASSADGENIFFPIKKSDVSDFGANSYRCADVNDKNVNYIDFSFNVKVDKTFNANHAEFYLDQVPKITIGGADVSGNLVRMAITDTDTRKYGSVIAVLRQVIKMLSVKQRAIKVLRLFVLLSILLLILNLNQPSCLGLIKKK